MQYVLPYDSPNHENQLSMKSADYFCSNPAQSMTERLRDRQTHRHTDRQTARQTD